MQDWFQIPTLSSCALDGNAIRLDAMRMIGQLENEPTARTFSDFLYANGIENQIEADRDGSWALWIDDEDQIAIARGFLDEFRSNQGAAKFSSAGDKAEARRRKEAAHDEAVRKRTFDSQRLFPAGVAGFGRLTLSLVLLSVAVAIYSKLGNNDRFLQPLYITEFKVRGGYIEWLKGLPEIRQGQVWRLWTPMFIHFGLPHLVFDMLGLAYLGSMIERRLGTGLLVCLVLVIAASSNYAQYFFSAPNFGGMSGVVYGLFGYTWMRGTFDPASGLFVPGNTIAMAVVWYFLCLVGIIPHVANTVHTVGFVIGLAWGFLSARIATRRLR